MWILCTDGKTIVNTDHITKIEIVEVDYGGYLLTAVNDIDDVIACLGRYETYAEAKEMFALICESIVNETIYFEMPK